jgi:hypothetical protein
MRTIFYEIVADSDMVIAHEEGRAKGFLELKSL